MTGIRFENVEKKYADQTVLDNFSMEVEPAQMTIILGGSGSGKSTILKMILGLVRPDSGHVFVGGQDISQLKEDELMPIRAHIGMVFQEGALFDSLTVAENVSYRLREQHVDSVKIRKTVETVLGFVGLEDAIDKMPSDLSGGMRRRVAIARALVGQPQIMLYDEPTAGLDPITSRTICELVMSLRDLENATSVFVTHDLKSARTMANEVAVKNVEDNTILFKERNGAQPNNTHFVILEGGRILLQGTADDLQDTHDPYIREFLD